MLIGARHVPWLVLLASACALLGTACHYDGAPCGGPGEECCPTGARCNAGYACESGYFYSACVACGGYGRPCCPSGAPCASGLACAGSSYGGASCRPCGEAHEPCCASGCVAGLVCHGNASGSGSTCEPCGDVSQWCCSGNLCNGSVRCNDLGQCGPCGVTGEVCCAGHQCATPSRCVTPVSGGAGNCEVCGSAGQPCCGGTRCYGSSLVCDGRNCQPCGALREACCAGDTCPTSGQCYVGVCTAAPPPDASLPPSSCANGSCDSAGMTCVPFPSSFCAPRCSVDRDCGLTGVCFDGACALTCTPGAGRCDPYGGACLASIPPFTLLSWSQGAARAVCIPSCYPASATAPSGYPACVDGTVCDPYSGGCEEPLTSHLTLGAPCRDGSDCAGSCVTSVTPTGARTGFIGGYCVTHARNPGRASFAPGAPLPASNCPPGGVAIPWPGAGSGDAVNCYAECTNDCDCRVGYHCDHDPLRLGATPAPNGACLPVDCSDPGTPCPSGTSCRTVAWVTYLMYPVCEASLSDAGIDAGTDLGQMNRGCAPDASTPDASLGTDASIDAPGSD